jgi:hypothetical protein
LSRRIGFGGQFGADFVVTRDRPARVETFFSSGLRDPVWKIVAGGKALAVVKGVAVFKTADGA